MERILVESSNLESVGYDEENEILEVEFKSGAVYRYYDVPPEVYEELMTADSHGSYFYWNIRDVFRYRRIE